MNVYLTSSPGQGACWERIHHTPLSTTFTLMGNWPMVKARAHVLQGVAMSKSQHTCRCPALAFPHRAGSIPACLRDQLGRPRDPLDPPRYREENQVKHMHTSYCGCLQP